MLEPRRRPREIGRLVVLNSKLSTSLPATNAKRLRKGAKATKQSILSLRGALDCFASLAMTAVNGARSKSYTVRTAGLRLRARLVGAASGGSRGTDSIGLISAAGFGGRTDSPAVPSSRVRAADRAAARSRRLLPWSSCGDASAASSSRMSTASVISSSSRLAAMPDAASAAITFSGSVPLNTHSPSWLIRPVSWASGTNSPGEFMPHCGWRQRTSASQPVIALVCRSRQGW